MSRIAFYGSLWTEDFARVADLLSSWMNTDDLNVKPRIFGEEITYENSGIYLYCHSAEDEEGGESSFLLEGHMVRSLDEVRTQLYALADLCESRGIESDFEYVEINEQGEQVGEEFQLD